MPSLTITVSAAQAQTIADAYGQYLRLGRSATIEEVRQELIAHAKSVVQQVQVQQVASTTAAQPLADIT